jgi:hypothetical protein
MPQVVIASGLSPDDPRKAGVERAVVEELEETAEPWMVVLSVHPAQSWWSLKITRIRDGFVQSLVIGENHQTPHALRQSLRTVIRTAHARRYDDVPVHNPEVF